MVAARYWFFAPLVIAVMTTSAAAQIIHFTYSQTDLTTGGGTLSGFVDGVQYSGELPLATVTQNDSDNLAIPPGMIGYMNGHANPSTNGNDWGVHIGFPATVTLTGEKVTSATELELFELMLDLVIGADGNPAADWEYNATVTDDDGSGNDAFGEYRIAGWVGDPAMGHRHSGDTRTFLEGVVDIFEMGGSHGDVGGDGRGDALGINFSFRDGPGDDGPIVDGGPVYIDSITWQGGVVPTRSPTKVGTAVPADFNGDGVVDLGDFAIMSANFNRSGTTRTGGGDLTGDHRTDLLDFVVFREAFSAAAGAAAVPEPNSVVLLLMGPIGLSSLARRRQ